MTALLPTLRHRRALRLGAAAWVVLALLLKAALPLLASQAAGLQGKATVEVCTAYGVATVALPGDGPSAPADHGAAHVAGEHCAAGAVLASLPPAVHAALWPATAAVDRWTTPARQAPPPDDADARWRAGLLRSPPLPV
ncbi:hypothetical protein [Aquabacterium sp. J223]|uniref:hypothetical protein n=1 Tax=Aquabacterium sp. J223 TaxID=2898431 RepID=UPI0021ADAF46|nr:hypothetical protein [Aquabacterium sp. J223]UUX95987.1 hypothetical protein LRS07_01165 [Aquabacterium sp. J223]